MRLLPLVLLTLGMPALAAAQEPAVPASTSARYIGKPVVEVRLETEGRPTSAASLEDLVQTRVGQPLAMSAVRESISHLFSLGRFQDVQVDATEAPGGVRLVYNLIPLHAVHRVAFRGNLGISESLLKDTLASRFGALPPVGRAPEAARFLEQQLYPDHGYLHATVRAVAVEQHDPDRTLLTFQIEAGPRAIIRSVTIEGDPLQDRESFLRRIGTVPGVAYQPLEITEELDRYAVELRRRGRYEATATFRREISGNGTDVQLILDVQPGPIVTLRFEGDPLPADRLDDFVPIQREASVHPDLVEDSEVRIRNYLAQEGYWKARATSRTELADGRLAIVFTIARGLAYRVADAVEVRGNLAVTNEELRPVLARLAPGDVFVESHLEAARASIDAMYRLRGFAQVAVAASASELNPTTDGFGQVKPLIVITEGPRTTIDAVTFEGNAYLSQERLRALVGSRPGDPYFAPRVSGDREAVLLEYLNEGFASADVQVTPTLSEDGTRASVVFTIAEGPQTLVDHILVVGNTKTDENVIRAELLFRQGEPLGLADLNESRRRLTALGLFRRVQITEISHGTSARHDVLVTVEESPRTTVSYGGGVEAARRRRAASPGGDAEDRLEFAPRGFFDIGRRNVGGKNRSVNLYTRSSLRQGRVTEADPDPGIGFSEYRVVGTYREPRPFGVPGDLIVTGALEQGVRTSFNFARRGVTAELVRRLSPLVRVSGRYSFATTRTFDEELTEEEQATIDRIFPRVRLSSFSGAISRDTRNDIVEPSRGMFVSAEGSVAARALGGQVGFLKSYGQMLWFREIPGTRGIVFATRAAVGLADLFPSTVREPDENGELVERTIEDLPASERFFAGGDTTIRGFALDSVGTEATISDRGFPRGGNAVIVLNGEFRVPLWKSVGAAVFVDGGNVFQRFGDFDLGNLRGAAGFGFRYSSPIGPIRFDLGFNMNRRQIGGRLESRVEPHFSIGHIF
jgi:outer membrane protein assembly complex protein YaeT